MLIKQINTININQKAYKHNLNAWLYYLLIIREHTSPWLIQEVPDL